jgi:hypothetical protein
VIGESGVGKSNFLASLALHDLAQGFSVCVIEPHRQLVTAILERLPEDRLKDVILLDLTETEFVPGLNLVERPHPPTVENMAASATLAYHVFTKLFAIDQASAPRLMQTLRALIYILMENDATLVESVLLLSSNSDMVRKKMVSRLTNPEILAFWQDYASRPAREQREQTDSTRNKLSAFLALPMVRNMVGQVKSLNLGEIMDSGKILLVNLSPRFEEASALIAEIILTKLLLAGFARSDVPEASRRPCMLILDEYQRYATATAAVFLREARKFRIATTLATQTLASLTEENRAAALACGNLMVFRVSGQDAPVLARSFDATPEPHPQWIGAEPLLVPVADCVDHLVKYGHSDLRVAHFSQGPLRNFEHFMHESHPIAYCREVHGGELLIHPGDMRRGRQLLNETFARCMREHTAKLPIPPLALYLLAASQKNYCEWSMERLVKSKGLFVDQTFDGFYPGAENVDEVWHLQSLRKKQRWYRPLTQELSCAQALVSLITELRYCLTALANAPILTPTGEMRPKVQPRTYADMTNQRASELTTLPNYLARVKFLSSGEQVLQTRPLPPPVSEAELTARLEYIKRRMWSEGLTRWYKDVEKEICEREVLWRGETLGGTGQRGAKAPPTSY